MRLIFCLVFFVTETETLSNNDFFILEIFNKRNLEIDLFAVFSIWIFAMWLLNLYEV